MRADLWDFQTDKPAAWAVLEARLEGQPPVRGLANEQGRIALIFPYPEPAPALVTSPPGSPPGGARRPLSEQTWLIQLQAFYTPRTPTLPIPHLEDVLNQAPATLLDSLSPLVALSDVSLAFGKELIVKSQSRSTLLLIPTGSPL